MTSFSEKSVVASITKWLRSQGAWVYKTHGSQYGRGGVPDLLVCFQGAFFAFEVKNETGRPSKLQQIEIERIERSEGRAYIVRSVDEVRKIIDNYCENPNGD